MHHVRKDATKLEFWVKLRDQNSNSKRSVEDYVHADSGLAHQEHRVEGWVVVLETIKDLEKDHHRGHH